MNITIDNTFEEIEVALREQPFPARPVKPTISSKSNTPAEFRAHADALECYDRDIVKYNADVANYRADRRRLETIWNTKLRNEYFYLNDATFNACYTKAYEDGHSAGYDEVRGCMGDIVDFAQKIVSANK